MAQVKFYGMTLAFKTVRDLYVLSETQFDALIFQFEIAEPRRLNDKFVLIAYPVDKTGNITPGKEKITLVQGSRDHDVDNKLLFGNLKFTRNGIKPFYDYDKDVRPIDHLYFDPYKFTNTAGSGEYVAYKIISIDAAQAIIPFVVYVLNPSPPAIPPEFLPA